MLDADWFIVLLRPITSRKMKRKKKKKNKGRQERKKEKKKKTNQINKKDTKKKKIFFFFFFFFFSFSFFFLFLSSSSSLIFLAGLAFKREQKKPDSINTHFALHLLAPFLLFTLYLSPTLFLLPSKSLFKDGPPRFLRHDR